MFKPQTTMAQYTREIIGHGVAKGVSQYALIYFYDEEAFTGKFEWHVFGEPTIVVPSVWAARYPNTAVIDHPETLFPPALNDLPNGEFGLYDLAKSAEFNVLSLGEYKPQYSSLWTDGVEATSGVSHDVNWHAIVWEFNEILNQGRNRWHYYGTQMPNPLPDLNQYPDAEGVQHPPTHFPSALANLPEGDYGLYSLALEIELFRLGI